MDYLNEAQTEVTAYLAEHPLPNYFYYCLFGELVKIWGIRFVTPDPNYLVEYDDDFHVIEPNTDDYSYKDQIDYFLTVQGGTSGWYEAFKEACVQCNLQDLLDYYNSIDWVHSDYFDGCIADKMVEVLFAEDARSDYYQFKTNKENK